MRKNFVTIGFKEHIRKVEIRQSTYDLLMATDNLEFLTSIQTTCGRIDFNKSQVLFVELSYEY